MLSAVSDVEWEAMHTIPGLVVVDVYCGWAGPCLVMDHHLRRLRVTHVSTEDKYGQWENSNLLL